MGPVGDPARTGRAGPGRAGRPRPRGLRPAGGDRRVPRGRAVGRRRRTGSGSCCSTRRSAGWRRRRSSSSTGRSRSRWPTARRPALPIVDELVAAGRPVGLAPAAERARRAAHPPRPDRRGARASWSSPSGCAATSASARCCSASSPPCANNDRWLGQSGCPSTSRARTPAASSASSAAAATDDARRRSSPRTASLIAGTARGATLSSRTPSPTSSPWPSRRRPARRRPRPAPGRRRPGRRRRSAAARPGRTGRPTGATASLPRSAASAYWVRSLVPMLKKSTCGANARRLQRRRRHLDHDPDLQAGGLAAAGQLDRVVEHPPGARRARPAC